MRAKAPQGRRHRLLSSPRTSVTIGLVALVLVPLFAAPLHRASSAVKRDCSNPTTGLIPLTEMGQGTYQGHEGGLYPGGNNEIPEDHLALGMQLSAQITPRDQQGNPDPEGIIGLISVGVSNTSTKFGRFMELLRDQPDVAGAVVAINGAKGSAPLDEWAEGAGSQVWREVSEDVARLQLSPAQVQAAWVMLPSENRGTVALEDAAREIEQMGEVLRMLKIDFPNLQIAYLSSRNYAGYAGGEPAAYQHGFTTKWLIENQITGAPELNADSASGEVVAPWLAWGPYIWADGTTPRQDGLTWECDDFEDDGIHPDDGAADKVATMLLDFLGTDPTASQWFLGTAPPQTTSSGSTVASATSTTPGTRAPAIAPGSPAPETGTNGVNGPWLMGGLALAVVASIGVINWLRRRPPDDSRTDGPDSPG